MLIVLRRARASSGEAECKPIKGEEGRAGTTRALRVTISDPKGAREVYAFGRQAWGLENGAVTSENSTRAKREGCETMRRGETRRDELLSYSSAKVVVI
jgi:hypothetical protein